MGKVQTATLFLVMACTALPPPVHADEHPTFSVDVSVVNVFATVRDRDGRLVTDLDQEDFILEENGEQQGIEYFARESDVPLTIGLLVDTSASQRRLMRRQRRASAQFFRQVLRPESDQVFLIKFDFSVELLQDLTRNKQDLLWALEELRAPALGRRPATGRGVVGTSMYDAVYLAADEIMREQEGRKAIILVTDGVDLGSIMPLDTAIEYAQRSDTIVYGIRYYDPDGYIRPTRGLFGGGPGRKGSKTMKRLSKETGGRTFEVGDELTLEQIFDHIQQELRSQYSIGYTPATKGREFRKIELRCKQKKLTVQSRTGYYPKP
jgi:VWFA-related protein